MLTCWFNPLVDPCMLVHTFESSIQHTAFPPLLSHFFLSVSRTVSLFLSHFLSPLLFDLSFEQARRHSSDCNSLCFAALNAHIAYSCIYIYIVSLFTRVIYYYFYFINILLRDKKYISLKIYIIILKY